MGFTQRVVWNTDSPTCGNSGVWVGVQLPLQAHTAYWDPTRPGDYRADTKSCCLPLLTPGTHYPSRLQVFPGRLCSCRGPGPPPSLPRAHLPVRHVLHDDGLLLQVLPKHLQNPVGMEWVVGDRPEHRETPEKTCQILPCSTPITSCHSQPCMCQPFLSFPSPTNIYCPPAAASMSPPPGSLPILALGSPPHMPGHSCQPPNAFLSCPALQAGTLRPVTFQPWSLQPHLRSFSACNSGINAMRASKSSICRRL